MSYKVSTWFYFMGSHKIYIQSTTQYGGIKTGLWNEFAQTGKETCGQAVLAFFLSKLGIQATETSIIKQLDSSSMLSLADLENVFSSYGFKTQLLKVQPTYFKRQPVTAILHFTQEHFVVFLEEIDGEAMIFDPSYGQVYVSWNKLLALFSGYMLYIYN
jgi:ABC-type bacteriocin/lantibiotic exporter with double-glycine peptidase domain